MVVGYRGIHWLDPDGSTGLLVETRNPDDYWWAAW